MKLQIQENAGELLHRLNECYASRMILRRELNYFAVCRSPRRRPNSAVLCCKLQVKTSQDAYSSSSHWKVLDVSGQQRSLTLVPEL
jgi:hypothetical protein